MTYDKRKWLRVRNNLVDVTEFTSTEIRDTLYSFTEPANKVISFMWYGADMVAKMIEYDVISACLSLNDLGIVIERIVGQLRSAIYFLEKALAQMTCPFRDVTVFYDQDISQFWTTTRELINHIIGFLNKIRKRIIDLAVRVYSRMRF